MKEFKESSSNENEEIKEEEKKNHTKEVVITSAVLLALLGIGGGALYHYNSPAHHREETQENVQEVAKTPVDKTFPLNKSDEKKKPTISFNPNNIKGVPTLDELDALQDKVISGEEPVIKKGNIAIPSLDIQCPIYEGTTQYTLAVGAGTAKPNQQLGKGNYALAAHNMIKAYGLNNYFFSNFETKLAQNQSELPSVLANTQGVHAYVSDDSHVYEYVLKQSELVPYTNGRVILDETKPFGKNVPVLTLYTCGEEADTTNPYYRIVVQGRFVKKYSMNEFKKEFKNYTHIFDQPTWLKEN